MGRIWLCQEQTAKTPFFVEEEGIYLYSLEELCYYVYHNAEVIEEELFEEKLFLWMEEQLGKRKLAELLRQGKGQKKSSFWYIGTILADSGYYSARELQCIQETADMADQQDFMERRKLRADHMMNRRKYKMAALEYAGILYDAGTETPKELMAKLWHNLGTAYARQMLFAQAASCYKTAYETGGSEESRRQYLLACDCVIDQKKAKGEKAMPDTLCRLEELRRSGERNRYEQELYQELERLETEYRKSE